MVWGKWICGELSFGALSSYYHAESFYGDPHVWEFGKAFALAGGSMLSGFQFPKSVQDIIRDRQEEAGGISSRPPP